MSEQGGEKIIYQEGEITITTMRATIEGQTTLIENIRSVETVKDTGRIGAPILLGFFSIVAISGGIYLMQQPGSLGWVPLVAGLISLAAAIYLSTMIKPLYNVKITTRSGDLTAIGSLDKEFVDSIKKAIETAVLERKAGLSGETQS
jgi:hypothetical protein